MSEDRLDLILKAICLHIHTANYAGSETVDKTKKKSRSVCMLVIFQNLYVLINIFSSAPSRKYLSRISAQAWLSESA